MKKSLILLLITAVSGCTFFGGNSFESSLENCVGTGAFGCKAEHIQHPFSYGPNPDFENMNQEKRRKERQQCIENPDSYGCDGFLKKKKQEAEAVEKQHQEYLESQCAQPWYARITTRGLSGLFTSCDEVMKNKSKVVQ